MNEEKAFLPHFFDEEIYVIDDVNSVQDIPTKQMIKEEPVTTVAEEPKQQYEVPKVEEEKPPIIELTYEGQNAKGIVLIVQSITSEEKMFLEKVLGAVKLTMNDCALLQLSQNNSEGHQSLIENFDCKIIINLGGKNLSFLQEINNYKINFVDSKKALQTNDLRSIMVDVSKKKLLWECLQQLFLQ